MEFGIAVLPAGQLPRILDGIWDVPFYLAFVIFVRDLSYLEPSRRAVILRLSILVSGDMGFQLWGFLLCGEASLFLSDVAWLWVLLAFRGQSDKRYIWGT